MRKISPLGKAVYLGYLVKLLKAWMTSTQLDPAIHNGPTQWPVAVVPAAESIRLLRKWGAGPGR